MINPPNVGSTARGGILGRRKRGSKEAPTDGVELLKRQLASLNPVLRQLATEAQTLALETRKTEGEATLAKCENEPLKTRRNAGVLRGRKPEAPPAKRHPHCRYCGAPSAYPWGAPQICAGCEKIRDRHEAAAEGWIGDDTLYLRVQRTMANREGGVAAERLAKHGPGRLERDGPGVKMSEAVGKAKRVARAKFRRANEQLEEAAE
jgi:hypothetical protein